MTGEAARIPLRKKTLQSALGEAACRAAAGPKKRRVPIAPYLYILPSLILFGLFVFYPFVRTFALSFFSTDQRGAASLWAGLENYRNLLTSRDFMMSLRVTLEFAAKVVLGSMALGLVAAILANEAIPMRSLFRTVYAMPLAVSSACITVISVFILNPTMGVLNYLLGTQTRWLSDVHTALNSVAAVTIWLYVGINYIFLIAALQMVDTSLYESAQIDGAGFFRKHLHITLPGISPTLFFLMIVNVLNSFQSYAQVNLMTQGGPGKFTRVIIYQIFLEAFQYNRFGAAAAQSVVLFLIMLILTLAQFRLERKVSY
jgi:sn-glycerol 3-phosphate transport system permease protein